MVFQDSFPKYTDFKIVQKKRTILLLWSINRDTFVIVTESWRVIKPTLYYQRILPDIITTDILHRSMFYVNH